MSEVGQIYTPEQVRTMSQQLNQEFRRFNSEVRSERLKVVPVAIREEWGRLFLRWASYYRSLSGSLWERLWGSAVDQIERFQREMLALRRRIESQGVTLQTTPPAVLPGNQSGSDVSKWMILGAVVLAGVYFYGRHGG